MSFLFKEPIIFNVSGKDFLEFNGMPKNAINVAQWLYEHQNIFLRIQRQAIFAGSNAVCIPKNEGFSMSSGGVETSEIDKKLISLAKGISPNKRIYVGGIVGSEENNKLLYMLENFDIIHENCVKRATSLKEAGADFVLIEKQTSLLHMRACVLAAKRVGIPIFVSINTLEDGTTLNNTSILSSLITLQAMGADAIGIEGNLSLKAMKNVIEKISYHAVVPIFIRPNNLYLSNDNFSEFKEKMISLLDLGTFGFWGQFDRYKEYCSLLRLVVRKYNFEALKNKEKNNFACATQTQTFFINEDIKPTEPILCGYGLDEDLKEAERKHQNVITVKLESIYDVKVLIENSYMIKVPICIISDNIGILEIALKNFQGRLMIDTQSLINKEILNKLSEKYGSVLY